LQASDVTLVNQQLRVTRDVDEQHMSDLEFNTCGMVARLRAFANSARRRGGSVVVGGGFGGLADEKGNRDRPLNPASATCSVAVARPNREQHSVYCKKLLDLER
jgi:hypothetical protein